MSASTIHPRFTCTLAAIGLLGAPFVATAHAAVTCPPVTPAEVSAAFDGKLSVEVQEGASDGCMLEISGRSFSHLHLQELASNRAGNVVEGAVRMVEEGEVEGRLVDELGETAVLTPGTLKVGLADGSALILSMSIYGESLNPLLEEEEKEAGLLRLGRLLVERHGS